MSISRYIIVAAVRCSRAWSPLLVHPYSLGRGILRGDRAQDSQGVCFAPALLVTAGDLHGTAGGSASFLDPSLDQGRLSQDEKTKRQEDVPVLADGLDAFPQKCDGFPGAVREQIGVAEGDSRRRCHPGHARFHGDANGLLQRTDDRRPSGVVERF